jgi:hypothetical protein
MPLHSAVVVMIVDLTRRINSKWAVVGLCHYCNLCAICTFTVDSKLQSTGVVVTSQIFNQWEQGSNFCRGIDIRDWCSAWLLAISAGERRIASFRKSKTALIQVLTYIPSFDILCHCTRHDVVKQPKYRSGDTWNPYVCTTLFSLFASSLITWLRLGVTKPSNKITLESS